MYAADWTPERVEVRVAGERVRRCPHPPSYPMQVMLAVFDVPDRSTGAHADAAPS